MEATKSESTVRAVDVETPIETPGDHNATDATPPVPDWWNVAADRLFTTTLFFYLVMSVWCGLAVFTDVVTVPPWRAARVYAGYCAFATVVLTSAMIYGHLIAYTNPPQQRRIIRVLLMVPVLAVNSFISTLDIRHMAQAVDVIRDTYQCYAMYNFAHLMMGYLGGRVAIFEKVETSRKIVQHIWPFSCCYPKGFQLSQKILTRWQFFLVQFMVLNPLCTIVTIYLMYRGVYDDSDFSLGSSNLWIQIVLNVSVTLALYAMQNISSEFQEELKEFDKGGWKVFMVETLLFFTFYQSFFLSIVVELGYIRGSKHGVWTSDEVTTGVSDWLICPQMLTTCYIMRRVFSEEPYLPFIEVTDPDSSPEHKINAENLPPIRRRQHGTSAKWWAVRHAFSIEDVIQDVLGKCDSRDTEDEVVGGGRQVHADSAPPRNQVPRPKSSDGLV